MAPAFTSSTTASDPQYLVALIRALFPSCVMTDSSHMEVVMLTTYFIQQVYIGSSLHQLYNSVRSTISGSSHQSTVSILCDDRLCIFIRHGHSDINNLLYPAGVHWLQPSPALQQFQFYHTWQLSSEQIFHPV